jgi:tetratricopeptide (TPR) repeat protein
MTPDQINGMCATCHAKLSPLTAEFVPGERFLDHFALTTLEDTDFYPDGRDLGENFTETTWRLSPCLKSGKLDCVDCHTSSGRYRFREGVGEPNAACLPCHAERVKDIAAHSHHPAGSAASKCIACHMPMTEFGRMHRSDHSMRPPAPAATIAFGSPNACNLCHADKDAKWADGHVRQWHKRDYQAPILHRGGLILAARRGEWQKLPDIVKYLLDANREEVWSASLLRLLRGCPDDAKWPAVRACLQDRSPLVRGAAVEALGDVPNLGAMDLLLAATRDEFRLVRTRAAATLAAAPRDRLNEADRRALEAATNEYLASLQTRPDDWASHYNLGNFYMERQEPAKAVESYSRAVHFQPQGLPPLVNRALAHAALGQNDRAEASLRQALALDPANAATNLNLALLLAELGRMGEAEQAFRTALKSDPQSAVAAYNLGVLLSKDRPVEAIELCRKAATLRPQEGRYAYTLGFFLNAQGRTDEAIRVLEAAIRQPGAQPDAFMLLGSIYERQRRLIEATAVYRLAAASPAFAPADRAQFEARARQLTGR